MEEGTVGMVRQSNSVVISVNSELEAKNILIRSANYQGPEKELFFRNMFAGGKEAMWFLHSNANYVPRRHASWSPLTH